MSDLICSRLNVIDMPPEVICMIGNWGQNMWLNGVFDPFLEPDDPPTVPVSRGLNCFGSTGLVSHCLRDENRPIRDPSFLQNMLRVCKKFATCLREDRLLWQLESTLYGRLVAHAGPTESAPSYSQAVGGRIHYPGGILVAAVCSHLQPPIFAWYSSLIDVHVKIPGESRSEFETSVWRPFFSYLHDGEGPLQRFHLWTDVTPQVRCDILETWESANIRHCLVTNVPAFLHGPALTVLSIRFPTQRSEYTVVIRRNFLVALDACSRLEYLTLILGDTAVDLIPDVEDDAFEANSADTVDLPRLRYLRLSMLINDGAQVLRRLQLPAQIDMHLDPIAAFSDNAAGFRPDGHPPVGGTSLNPQDGVDQLWRYAASLQAPEQTARIFGDQGAPHLSGSSLWDAMRVAALDITLSSAPRAGMRWERPQFNILQRVTTLFAPSMHEMRQMLCDGSRGARYAPEVSSKTGARRSLSITEVDLCGGESAAIQRALYEITRYISSLATSRDPGTPSLGRSEITHLVLPASSFVFGDSPGWASVLESFPDIKELTLLCPVASENLRALARCLEYSGPSGWRCLRLERISVSQREPQLAGVTEEKLCAALGKSINAPNGRLAAGAEMIVWEF